MERFLIKVITIMFGFLRWALIHLIIEPFVRNNVERPGARLVMRLLGLGDQGPDPAQDMDVERGEGRGEAPGLDV